MPSDASPRPEAFGKYRLIAKLGHGGMAEVFLAVARGPASFNKLVVIKRLRSVVAEQDGHVAMFMDEARLSARLNHPNIVHTYEVGDRAGEPFIVMEYLDGQPLNRVAKAVSSHEPGSEKFDRAMMVKIVIDALTGLHYAHELADYDGTALCIVHRDISPHNLFVTYEGAVKIVDFGIAKAAVNANHTETGLFKGKVAYISPEQAMGSKQLDRRADLFSMGVVLWELVAGKRLFDGSSVSTLHKLLNEDAPRLSTAVADIDPELDEIAAKALARDASERYATALEMRNALERYLKNKGLEVRGETIGEAMAGAFGDRRATVRKQIRDQMEALDRAPELGGQDVSTSGVWTAATTVAGVTGKSLPTIDDGANTGSSKVSRHGASSGRMTGGEGSTGKRTGVVIGAVVVALAAAVAVVGLSTRAPAPAAKLAEPAASAPAAPPTAGVGQLSLATDPAEARVTLDGKAVGRTPFRADLPAGSHTVVLSKDGFQEETLLIAITASSLVDRAISLKAAPDASAGPAKAESDRPSDRPSRGSGRGARAAAAAAAAAAAPTVDPKAEPPKVDKPAPPPPSVAQPPPKPGIQVLGGDDAKPKVNVNIVQ